jgi:hypothetical protein
MMLLKLATTDATKNMNIVVIHQPILSFMLYAESRHKTLCFISIWCSLHQRVSLSRIGFHRWKFLPNYVVLPPNSVEICLIL